MIVQEYNKANIDVNNNDNGCEGVLFVLIIRCCSMLI